MKRRWQLALPCVVVCAGVVIAEEARAEAPAEEASRGVAPSRKEEPPTFRVDAGLELASGLGAGTAGPVAGPILPLANVGFEWRLRGPFWAFVRGGGGIVSSDQGAAQHLDWNAGGQVGVRLELPVLDWMDVGGHLMVGASAARSEERLGEDVYWGASSLEAGGRLGVAAHLHPTTFFGTRLSLGLLDAGYAIVAQGDQRASNAYAHVTARPAVELTFSF